MTRSQRLDLVLAIAGVILVARPAGWVTVAGLVALAVVFVVDVRQHPGER